LVCCSKKNLATLTGTYFQKPLIQSKPSTHVNEQSCVKLKTLNQNQSSGVVINK
jgi:hypothetical protein